MIVPEPELLELDDELEAGALELEPELELELLEPHAATTSEAATARATALMRRIFNFFSFTRCTAESLRAQALRC